MSNRGHVNTLNNKKHGQISFDSGSHSIEAAKPTVLTHISILGDANGLDLDEMRESLFDSLGDNSAVARKTRPAETEGGEASEPPSEEAKGNQAE